MKKLVFELGNFETIYFEALRGIDEFDKKFYKQIKINKIL